MALSIPAHLKHGGNLNRINELHTEGCSAAEIQDCFSRGRIHLKVVQGDFPLMGNLQEMTRKALPKHVVKDYLRERRQPGLMPA
jgi:hypothetical protein